jgi:hypothetical protein
VQRRKKLPPNFKENALKEIRSKKFERSMEKKESKEKDEPDIEL